MSRKRKLEEQYFYIEAEIVSYEARAEASLNSNAFGPQYALNLDRDDPVYKFTSQLSVIARQIYPEKQTGAEYEIAFYGDDAPSRRLGLTLGDIQVRDKHGAGQYRSYRGQEIPVYAPPPGLCCLEKVRGVARWHGWISTTPRFLNDALLLLGQSRKLFLGIHEHKKDRSRWIRNISLQTAPPI